MELLQVSPATAAAPWETGAIIAGSATAFEPAILPAEPVIGVPLRCRFGLHRWLPLAMGFSGAHRQLSLSFCRDCPAIRRPALH